MSKMKKLGVFIASIVLFGPYIIIHWALYLFLSREREVK